MPDLQLTQVAEAILFRYPNPVENQQLKRALVEELDYESVPSGGPFISQDEAGGFIGFGADSNVVAEDNALKVVYNEQANLRGLNNCAFITVREENGDFERLYDKFTPLKDLIVDNLGAPGEVTSYELTVNGNVLLDDFTDLTGMFSEWILDELKEFSGAEQNGTAVRLESEASPENWFRLTIDTKNSNNPLKWSLNYLNRREDYSDTDVDEVFDIPDIIVR